MSAVRPPAGGEPQRRPPFLSGLLRWRSRGAALRRLVAARPVVVLAPAAAVSGLLVGALGIVLASWGLALAGLAGAAVALGVAAGESPPFRRQTSDEVPHGDLGLRSLRAAVVLIVGVFALTITASVADLDDPSGRLLARVAGGLALTISCGSFGYALTMRRTAAGDRRPDRVFVFIALLLIGFILVTLSARLPLLLLGG
jgi:hypothetical protein